MSKIFRVHSKGGSENIEHWQAISGHLTKDHINSIADPSGSTAHTQITSIPSPFARMDLVRTAFEFVNSIKNLDAATIYHKLVSDCLDVAEIFFNIEALQDKIEVLQFSTGIRVVAGELDIDPVSDLGRLLNGSGSGAGSASAGGSASAKHRLLGETLKMYLFQDRSAFNFADFKHCYLLNYKQGPEIINIIGGTSPATLFFSSANDLSYVDIRFGNDKVFDDHFVPLYKRNKEFVKYLFAFRRSFSDFSVKFPDLNTYLDETYALLDRELKDAIRHMDGDAHAYKHSYDLLPVVAEGNNAEILGVPLRVKNYGVDPSTDENDFVIQLDPGKSVEGFVPLVLPKEAFNEPLRYAGGVWQSSYSESVPYLDERSLADRVLPNQAHIKYPYLTVSDLLQPYLIRLPYALDDKRFFDGNYEVRQGDKDHSYVLPLKKKYFEYFSAAGLRGRVSDGRKRIELIQMAGGVKVVLRIPIRGGRYVQLSRLYNFNQLQDTIQPANERENVGIVVDNQFTLAVYPWIRVDTPDFNPHYRILLVDRDVAVATKQNNYTVSFFREDRPLEPMRPLAVKPRSSKHMSTGVTTIYSILEQNFDLIEVVNNTASGMLIPLFEPLPMPSRSFRFAIDFGTSNTHIEYKDSREDITRPFEINEKDVQVGTLHLPGEATESNLLNPKLGFGAIALLGIIREEFLPLQINRSIQYKFPQRTVINDNGSFNPDDSNFALADFNIPFWYLKEDRGLNSEVTANLKWSDFRNDKRLERRTKAFLKQLLLMIRNKVLLEGGDVASTEIVWFYPSSMPVFRRRFFQNSWSTYYQRYFPGASRLYRMSESFAPFYHYYHKENVRPHDRPAVNIDIGGGTTDIVIYQSEDPILLTSFRFAANSIFGDGYGSTSAANGFVQHFEGKIKESLNNTKAGALTHIYDVIKQKNSKSVELIEFFFSLEENKTIKDNRIPLSFSRLLAEGTEFKLVFIFFYAAIVYHIARLMKARGLAIPEYITFSGNGSKVIRLAGGGSDLGTLLGYTKVIFGEVYGVSSVPAMEFRLTANPKEITCKGGLECADPSRFDTLEKQILATLTGVDGASTVPPASLKYTELQSDAVVSGVVGEVSSFIDLFFALNARYNYYSYFGIDGKGFAEYKEILKSRLKSDLIDGIRQKLAEVEGNEDVEITETLFFYPLIGAINRLAYSIQKNNQ
jgi:hypothetical protein